MNNTMVALPLRRVSGPISLAHSGAPAVSRASAADPATVLMTDFTRTAVFSIGLDVEIDQALLYMKAVGVRFLFVLDAGALVGLVTSTDIQGEKPLRYLQAANCTRADILVKHIMTPLDHWEVIDYSDVEKARISHIVDSFKATGRRHLVVVENMLVRGIFSATRVEQALGIQLNLVQTARSFAEIESALIR